MRTLLTIGNIRFISPDAKIAAQVADLIGQMQRVEQHYTDDKENRYALIANHTAYSHKIGIESLDGYVVFENEKAFAEWQNSLTQKASKVLPESEAK